MAAKPVNYSKWDHIDISDDEGTFHPNLDTRLNVKVLFL